MKTVNTISDIARIAGVSKSTVSRALNNSTLISQKTRERIQAIAKKYNFTLHKGAQNLSLQKNHSIALIAPMGAKADNSINDPYLIEILKSIIEATTKLGYDLLIGRPHNHSSEEILRYIDSNRTDGVILVGCGIKETVKKVTGLSSVITVGDNLSASLCSVDCDNRKGGFLATQHLTQSGCKNIAFLGGIKNGNETLLRFAGYKEAMNIAGYEIDEHLIRFGDYTGKAGYETMTDWLAKNSSIDGLFSCSDLMAMGAIEAIREKGLIAGKDIAVVGFDDIPMAEFCSPPLTTIRQNIHEIGATAVTNLITNIKSGTISKTILPVELVIRQSSSWKRG